MRQAAQIPAPTADAEVYTAALGDMVRALQDFYRRSARDLPWRRSRDPYAIWVSEIMLQQTRVDTVVPRYRAFLRAFPTLQALARADVHEVLAAWAGLGYYRRARLLHKGAQQVCQSPSGSLPTTAAALRKVSGIGPYTAGAIASIAFAETTPLVDGNVSRVLARIFAEPAFIDTPAGSRLFWQLAGRLVTVASTTGTPGDFNQALMELGATVCTPRQPRCPTCPVQAFCLAAAKGRQGELPRKAKATAVQPLAISFAYHVDACGTYLVRRPLEGLWGGLWELPSAHGEDANAVLAAQGYVLGAELAEVRHLLTHRAVTARIFAATRVQPAPRHAAGRSFVAPLGAPLSTLARKAIVAARAAVLGPGP